MLTEEQVFELIKDVKEPFLHRTLGEIDAIEEVKLRAEGSHVSLKILMAQPQSAEQMKMQQELVGILKRNGAKTVGLRFDQLPDETIRKFQPAHATSTGSILEQGTQPTFIAVASGKGGVGKSTVTVNLAMSLMRLGKKVGIIDADIYGLSVPDMMGIEKRPVVRGDKIIPVERFGIKVISMGFFVEDNSPIVWRGPMLGKMLTSFFQEVEWGDLDYLLFDLLPGTGDIALDVHELIPSCKEIIVTTPHATAAFVAARAGQMALKTNHEILGVVENMAYFESKKTGEKEYVFGQGGGDKLAEVLKTKVLGRLPLQQPYEEDDVFAPSVYQEDHPIGKEYHKIAAKVVAVTEDET